MKQKVYIDATIPSFYFDQRKNLAVFTKVTKQWWEKESKNYEIWISNAVLQELETGNHPHKKEIIDFAGQIPLLEDNSDIEQVANFYIENYVMPKSLVGDAIHLAYTSIYNIDFLLTWNCNHLANANKRKHIRVINGRLGLPTPEIITPMELFQEMEDNNDIE